ncbi:MAG: hypothetical protein AAGI51_16475 [Pseudomonadota bacterium]
MSSQSPSKHRVVTAAQQAIFLGELRSLLQRCFASFEAYNAAISKPDSKIAELYVHLDTVLDCAAAISRVLHPAKDGKPGAASKRRAARGAALRGLIGAEVAKPFAGRKLREFLAERDVQLDRWAETAPPGAVVRGIASDGSDAATAAFFDRIETQAKTYRFPGGEVDLQALATALSALGERVATLQRTPNSLRDVET